MKSDMRISRTSFFSEGGIQKDFAWLLSIAISYMIGVRIGLFFRVESIGMATIWPPSGIALAALILSEKKKWVWVILVIFASNVFGNLLGDNSLLISLGFALANITESLVCAFILTFFLGSAITFSRMTEVCVLIGIALFANAIIALLGASIPALAFGAQFFDTWLVWWIADGLGIILVTPFLIVWLTNPNILQNLTARRLIEAIILLFIISAASWLPFDTSIAEKIPYFRYYMIFPLLIWMTFRFSQRSVLTMVLLFVVILLAMSLKGQFVSGLTDQQVRILILSIQILFIIVTITVLILTAVIYERKLAEAALSKSEIRYKTLFNNAAFGMYRMDILESRAIHVNYLGAKLFGYASQEEFIAQFIAQEHYVDLKDREKLLNTLKNSGHVDNAYIEYIKKDGTTFWGEYTGFLIDDDSQVDAFIIDVTNRKKIEDALRESEERLKETAMIANVGGWEIDLLGNILFWTEETFRIHELEDERLPDVDKAIQYYYPEDQQIVTDAVQRAIEKGEGFDFEARLITEKKNLKWVRAIGNIVMHRGNRVKVRGTVQDITDRKKAEEQIKASLKEKETLLQEIHHRVKNNMTVISSLLNLQMNSTDNQIAKDALQDSKNRIQSMSMIHETLYRSDNLSTIDLKKYLSELGRTIFQNYSINNKVQFKVEAENTMISLKQASPVGLIVNELFSNCLKYAFSDGREGEVLLDLKLNKEKEVELTVSDNGVGIPEGFDLNNADSLGLKLVKMLVKNQLDGSIDIESKNGTKFIIKFNIDNT